MKKLLISTFIVLSLYSSGAYGAALVAAQPQQPTRLQKIIETIRQAGYSLTEDDWKTASAERTRKTNCHHSSLAIMNLLTEIGHKWTNSLRIPRSTEEEFYGTLKELLAQADTDYAHAVTKVLLSDSPDHYVFWVVLNNSAHSFVIEKQNGTWTVYQSWADTFTPFEWLTTDNWRLVDDCFFTKLWQSYGQAKELNKKELIEFLSTIHTSIPRCLNPSWWVRIFRAA